MAQRMLTAELPLTGRRDRRGERSPVPALPHVLGDLLAAPTDRLDAVWERFVAEYSFLLLHVARAVARDRDERMDLYARMLDVLRADDCQRLRSYATHPDTKFTTWLVVVARRICIDHHRARFGRRRAGDGEKQAEQRAQRRALEHLVAAGDDPALLSADAAYEPDAVVRAAELSGAVQAAVATLAASDQLLLRLRFDDDLSAAEIARIMRLPSQFHVYRRLKTVLARLRGELAARGVEDPAS
jgi:RNA polymerase sigma factor (sigma-70 family)